MLVKTTIKNQVKQLIDAVDNSSIDRDAAVEEFTDRLSDIIIDAIKSAKITLSPGDIRVVGSQTAQQNVTPLILEGKLS